jgi:hypothetical protein
MKHELFVIYRAAKLSISSPAIAMALTIAMSITSLAQPSNELGSKGQVAEALLDNAIAARFAGAGLWRQQEASAAGDRPWRLHAVRGMDGSVQAKLSVLGVPGFADVTLEGQIIDSDAFGVLLDEKGQQVATFNAKLAADGNGGSFILGNGESGTWGYDEQTKAELSTTDVFPAKAE